MRNSSFVQLSSCKLAKIQTMLQNITVCKRQTLNTSTRSCVGCTINLHQPLKRHAPAASRLLRCGTHPAHAEAGRPVRRYRANQPLFKHQHMPVSAPILSFFYCHWWQCHREEEGSLCLTLVHTKSLVLLCFMRYTLPKEPSPSTLIGSYSSILCSKKVAQTAHYCPRRNPMQKPTDVSSNAGPLSLRWERQSTRWSGIRSPGCSRGAEALIRWRMQTPQAERNPVTTSPKSAQGGTAEAVHTLGRLQPRHKLFRTRGVLLGCLRGLAFSDAGPCRAPSWRRPSDRECFVESLIHRPSRLADFSSRGCRVTVTKTRSPFSSKPLGSTAVAAACGAQQPGSAQETAAGKAGSGKHGQECCQEAKEWDPKSFQEAQKHVSICALLFVVVWRKTFKK